MLDSQVCWEDVNVDVLLTRTTAREIQTQLLKDFSKRSELSDWFNRVCHHIYQQQAPDHNANVTVERIDSTTIITETESQECLESSQDTGSGTTNSSVPPSLFTSTQILSLTTPQNSLRSERETWESLLQPPPPNTPSLPPPSAQSTIDSTLLTDPTQLSAFETLQSFSTDFQPSLTAATTSRLQRINQNLELEIDKFANNVHALGAYKDAAENVADDILGVSAEALEKRDVEGRARAGGENGNVGMRDVLRGLSRVIDR